MKKAALLFLFPMTRLNIFVHDVQTIVCTFFMYRIKRVPALPAGATEEAERGLIPRVVAGFGAAPHSKGGRYAKTFAGHS